MLSIIKDDFSDGKRKLLDNQDFTDNEYSAMTKRTEILCKLSRCSYK
jgi:hypothetical protein